MLMVPQRRCGLASFRENTPDVKELLSAIQILPRTGTERYSVFNRGITVILKTR